MTDNDIFFMYEALKEAALAAAQADADAAAKEADAAKAAAAAKNVELGTPTLSHVTDFAKEMADAGIVTDKVSPVLLPRYTHGNPRFEAK